MVKKTKKTSTGATVQVVVPTKPKTVSTTPVKPVTSTTSATASTKSTTVSYRTPEGSVPVGFSVTVKSGVITAASATTKVGGTSGYYQDTFAQKVSGAVVGKKIAGLSLSAIGGASLTTNAFSQFVTSSF